MIFLTSDDGPIKAFPFADRAINILSQPRKKDDFINLVNRLYLPSVGTVGETKERLKIYFSSLKSSYTLDKIKADEIHFWNFERQPSFKSIQCANDELIYLEKGHPSDCHFLSGKGWRWAERGKHARNH